MNLNEILSKKSNEVTKEEMAFVFENLDWAKLASKYAENVGDIDFEIPAEELKNYIRVDEQKIDSE
jgi:hypothetical protein